MHRIDTPTAQVDKFGAGKNGFTAGNPQTGTPATDLDEAFFDTLQEELSAVIENAGIALDKTQKNQLLTALQTSFQPLDAKLTALAALAGGANTMPYFNGANTAAQTPLTATARTLISQSTVANMQTFLGLGTAALVNVGTGTSQVPDMSAFAFLASGSGYTYLPNGLILQWGTVTPSANEITVTLPIIYPNAILEAFATSAHTLGNPATSIAAYGTYITPGTRGSFTARGSISTIGGRFWAIGY